jgi:O-antigen/teichoic acid export membrane protein
MSQTTDAAPIQPERSAGRTIARNTLFGIGAQFALKFANSALTILIVRSLGDEGFGQYNIVFAWTALFSVIGDLGITQYLMREIARDPRKTDELFWDTVILRFLLAILCTVVTVGGAIFLTTYSPELILGFGIFCLTYFMFMFVEPFNSLLTGNERIDLVSVLRVASQVIFMAICAVFLLFKLNYLWLVAAGVIAQPFVIALQIWVIRRNKLGPPRFRLNRKMWWTLIRLGLPFGFTQIALSFAFRVDTIVLSNYVSDAEVGLYSVAYGLVLTLLGIASSFSGAILPTLSREFGKSPETIRRWYYNSVKILMFLGLPIAVGTTLTATKIVALLYQPEIAPAAVALMILVWDLPFVMYHAFSGNIANSTLREGNAARIYISLGIVNLALNLFLIPRFGIIGASFSTVLTDVAGAAQFYFLFRREFGTGLGLKRIIRICLVAALMGGFIFILHDWDFLFIVPISAIFYLVLIWLSGAFTAEERGLFTRFIARRLHLRNAYSIDA